MGRLVELEAQKRRATARPRIKVGADLHRVVDEAERLLGDADVYQRDGRLLVLRQRDGATLAHHLSVRGLRAELSRIADFTKATAEGERPTAPPEDVAGALLEAGGWPTVRPLRRVVAAPFLRADGSVCHRVGYDPASACYLASAAGVSMPDAPNHGDAVAALAALREAWVDFPFVDEVAAHVPVAALLTVVGREAIAGPTPLVMITANVRGSGKTRVGDTVARIALGRSVPATPAPRDEVEWGKSLFAIARARPPVVLFDNVPDGAPFGAAELDAILTSGRFGGRILGSSETLDVDVASLFVATGNNPIFGADTSRRVLPCRLESRLENPEARDDFQHPDLTGWLTRHRGRLLGAALTLLAAFVRAGRPRCAQRWGGFESWSDLVASAIVWAGGPDVQLARHGIEAHDEGKSALEALLEAMGGWSGPVTARELLSRLWPAPDGRDVLLRFCPTAGDREPTPKSIGRRLRASAGRRVGGRFLADVGLDRTKSTLWRVKVETDPQRLPANLSNPAGEENQRE